MKTCPKCQTQNRDDAKFCQSCKYRFGTVAERAEASSSSGGTRLCPAGKHTMDPSWTICPYCTGSGSRPAAASKPAPTPSAEAGKPKRRKTIVENPSSRPPTEAEEDDKAIGAGRKRGKTKYDSGPGAPPAAKARVIGLLVTYTWDNTGQVLGLYQGRNVIGRAEECDICIEDDEQMSQKHAVIAYRNGRFLIDDEMSSNGAHVNGENVDEKRRLANYDEIRTGATVWRFIMIEPPTEED